MTTGTGGVQGLGGEKGSISIDCSKIANAATVVSIEGTLVQDADADTYCNISNDFDWKGELNLLVSSHASYIYNHASASSPSSDDLEEDEEDEHTLNLIELGHKTTTFQSTSFR